VPEQELLLLARAMADAEPLGVIEACRQLLERGREPSAVLQGLAGLLRDLLLAGVAPDRLELTSVSPALRPELPAVARSIGKARLLHWQAQLKGSEQQLRHSVQPRLWLEVLLLGLLAEPAAGAEPSRGAGVAAAQGREAAGAHSPGMAPQPAPTPVAPQATETRAASTATPEPRPAPALASDRGGGIRPEPPPTPQGSPGSPIPEPAAAPAPQNLGELWQQILAGLELPSTRMLLSQQAHLHRLDDRRAVVRVSGNWIAMVQSRLPLLEGALARALGSPRQVTLEAGDAAPPAGPTPAQAPERPPVVEAATAPQAPAGSGASPAAIDAGAAGEPQVGQQSAKPVPSPVPAAPETGAAPAEPVGSPGEPEAPAPAPPGKPAFHEPSKLDQRARQLADFFNGDVVDVSPDP
jgi:DNA polymerase-3 subunit gamma/tau